MRSYLNVPDLGLKAIATDMNIHLGRELVVTGFPFGSIALLNGLGVTLRHSSFRWPSRS
jgi:hypothetical protein